MSVFAHKGGSVTADGVFVFSVLAKKKSSVACEIVLPWVLPPSSVVGILYQRGLVLRILDFPLCKCESCSQKVTAINNLSSTHCVSPIILIPLIPPRIIISHHGPQRGTPGRSYGAETRGAAADGRVM